VLEHPLQLRIDDSGALDISVGGKTLASGKWLVSSAESVYSAAPPEGAPIGASTLKIISAVSPGIIEQTAAGMIASHTFTVQGDDLLITTAVANTGRLPIQTPRLSGLTVHFAKNAAGFMRSMDSSYTRAQGIDIMHPSGAMVPLGAAFADDGEFGVGLHTPSHLQKAKLIQAGYVENFIIPKECVAQIDFNDSVEPWETKTYALNFRFAMANDWKSNPSQAWQILLAAYKRDFQAELGSITYEPDDRPLAQFSAVDEGAIKPNNPYGFHSDIDRFDSPIGTREYLNMLLPGLRRAGGAGCLFWALAGWNPRGCNYRPDFDVFPPAIAANIPALIAGFKAVGLRVGLASRPGEYVDRETWTGDQTVQLCADSPDQMSKIWKRFENAIKLGFDMFYMDSFPLTQNHHRILQFLRKKAGPKILFFTEEGTEISAIYGGRYLEWGKGEQLSWTTPQLIEITRWLTPGASFLCKRIDEHVTVDRLGAMKLSPLMLDYTFADASPRSVPVQLFQIGQTYLNGKTWK
jgi:hypothetical protein